MEDDKINVKFGYTCIAKIFSLSKSCILIKIYE